MIDNILPGRRLGPRMAVGSWQSEQLMEYQGDRVVRNVPPLVVVVG